MKKQGTRGKIQTRNKRQDTRHKYCNLLFGYFLFLVTCILISLSLGCARTVTSIVPFGDQIVVTATLRGTIDVETTRYFLVFSDSASYKVPQPRPDIIEAAPEFIEPGSTPIVGAEEAYYSNFFLKNLYSILHL